MQTPGSKASGKKQYRIIEDTQRFQLLDLIVKDKMSIVQAARETGIHYENAKAIYRVYRLQGRKSKRATWPSRMRHLDSHDKATD